MPTRLLSAESNLTHLQQQAIDLLGAQRARQPAAAQRIREFHPRYHNADDDRIVEGSLTVEDAQLAIAREYGFLSWPRLKAFVENARYGELRAPRHTLITDPHFRRAVDLFDGGDGEGLRAHLKAHPELLHQRVSFEGWNYFQHPSLLEFIAENPKRNGRLPKSTAELARIILDANEKQDQQNLDNSLALVASSIVARECGVQTALIDLLCERGANPRAAHYAAALYGEFEAIRQLVQRGLPIDLLVATELDRLDAARATIAFADAETLQKALAMAAQWGYTDILGVILDAGANPNRYAPVGGHSHATPLHQAALAGHLDAVRLLVERGARTDIRDIHHNATALGWAHYGNQAEVVQLLDRITET